MAAKEHGGPGPPRGEETRLLERLEIGLENLVLVASFFEKRHGFLCISLRLRVLVRQFRQLHCCTITGLFHFDFDLSLPQLGKKKEKNKMGKKRLVCRLPLHPH
jgi:hypothetical protein